MASFNWRFEWDAQKAAANLAKHGITFQQAATVLLDPLAVTNFDEEHSNGEERWVTLGLSIAGIALVVVHTFEQQGPDAANVRVISARPATRAEMRNYEEGTL
ncbi:MAG TPA: BrnT family toxin [Bryobacteraceae bacterium]|nr:BrnT family toxin [Bryobacteraceae bacterium]